MWKVYPRVGGATQMTVVGAGAAGGLSPRGRGNRVGRRYRYDTLGSIPAWAGQPISVQHNQQQGKVYPRVGGATAASPSARLAAMGLSPRGRGNPHFANVIARPVLRYPFLPQ